MVDAAVLQVAFVSRRDGPPVVRVRAVGELDLANAAALARTLATATARKPARLEVDLADVTFFDCAALRALEAADLAADGRLRLVAASRPVHLLLSALGMRQRFAAV